MIRYLKHKEVDRGRWDLCVSQASNSLIYAYSWYLDIASPGWEALIWNDYEAVFPLTCRKKIFRYLYTPFFTQQLGMFALPKANCLLEDFLSNIPPEFRYVDIQLNDYYEPAEGIGKIKRRRNFVLDIYATYEEISAGYNEHTKRGIKKARKNSLKIIGIEPAVAVDFYVKEKSRQTFGVESDDYKMLLQLLEAANNHGMLMCRGVYNMENELLATAAIYSTTNRLYLINNCTNSAGREARAMYLLVDELIREFAGNRLLLDFEGSDMDGIARFNKGFGAKKQPYYRFMLNRLPFLVRWLKS